MLDRTVTDIPPALSCSLDTPLDRFAVHSRDWWLLLARIAMGSIFLVSGFGKLMGLGGFTASLASKGVPLTDLLGPLGAGVEFFGGLAIVLGIASRYAALLMIAFTIVATLISHRYWEFTDTAARRAQFTNFMKNLTIASGFLVLFVQGSGRIALDGLLRRLQRR